MSFAFALVAPKKSSKIPETTKDLLALSQVWYVIRGLKPFFPIIVLPISQKKKTREKKTMNHLKKTKQCEILIPRKQYSKTVERCKQERVYK